LEGADLVGVCAVVTRYFGGVLLGTGGLVRAYQDAVSTALAKAQLLEQVEALEVTAEVDYTLVGKLQNFISANSRVLGNEPEYGEKAVFHLLFESAQADILEKELIELTNGKIRLERGESRLRLLPVSED
jgi:putative IMPACT (imprinted ancient) family translation regulator